MDVRGSTVFLPHIMGATPPANGHERTLPTATDLLTRCQLLLQELETFKTYLKSRKQDSQIEIAHFRNTVKSEHRTLQRLCDQKDAQATQHTVNSSNLPFLETVWGVVKRNRGLQAMQKRFYWSEKGQRRGQKKQNSALVDVVAGDGLSWIKVSLLTNNRLLFDKAKLGWEDGSSSEEEEEDEVGEEQGKKEDQLENGGDEDDVPLVKMTKDLVRAAKEVKIRTRSPKITLVLPKIKEGEVDAIDKILDQLRKLGVQLITSSSAFFPIDFEKVMPHLLTDPFEAFTSTLNIDCTILLALVSDFSHCSVEAEPWFHRALKRQVEIEDEENLLPNLLYPALADRELVCTDEAAKRMREIVDTIGTEGEKERTKWFMGDIDAIPEDVRGKLTQLSRFPVPESLRLPIKTQTPDSISEPTTTTTSPNSTPSTSLPPSASKVSSQLTSINQSVFLHGWSQNITTITSNRTVVKQIENILAKEAKDETEWPLIWLCPTARSLVGKEKGRRE
ncbi:hypothetical protein D6D01_10390 [Aureobasidium pullulans]|uniref:DUF1308 domain-containing protein n=1 Tax=Aureobasidium pullulans TaxID=5580 RepID=A0A4S9JGC0_AURPU|nr:hypothetical protein D6D01_10390 [Aureobasidium pullulans]